MLKITIITVTYNSSATIADCITSVNKQNYPWIEHIIIDGASNDNTLKIINSIPNRVTKIISEPDEGIYDAMNKGIKLATGDIIGILNSDDLYIDNSVIKKIISEFESTSTDCIYADLFYVKRDNINQIVRHWRTSDYKSRSFKRGWCPAHPTFFVKREIYNKYGLFNLKFDLAADFELMLRFLECNRITSTYLNTTIVKMRVGGASNKSIRNSITQNIECYKAFKVNNLDVSPFYLLYRILPKLRQYLIISRN